MIKTQESQSAVAEYLVTRDRKSRMNLLAKIMQTGEYLPISLAEDLLELSLGSHEHLKVLEATGSDDRQALEHFYTRSLTVWNQELASLAILLWRDHTDHLMWYRFYECCDDPMLSQRVRYTLLDNLWTTGGVVVLKKMLAMDGLEDLSSAFHGLLLHRAVQWNIKVERLDRLAESVLMDLSQHLHPENKAIVSAISYIARFHNRDLETLVRQPALAEPWRDVVRSYLNVNSGAAKQVEKLEKFCAKPPKAKIAVKFDALWPAMWQRHELSAEVVADALKVFAVKPMEQAPQNPRRLFVSHPYEFFAGIPESTLTDAAMRLTGADFAGALGVVGSLLPMTPDADMVNKIKQTVTEAENPAECLELLPLRLRILLTTDESDKTLPYAQILADCREVITGKPSKVEFHDYAVDANKDPETAARKAYFSAMRGEKASVVAGVDFWSSLHEAWVKPERNKLDKLASLARQQNGPYRICYLQTLGRFQGQDEAALKILDFIRSKEEDDVRAVVTALKGIGTPRAAQELVASLTRPNINHAQRLEICSALADLDMSNLQKELRAAINDLGVEPAVDSSSFEVRESLSSLLAPIEQSAPATPGPAAKAEIDASDQALDQVLAGKIQHYRELSSEVKRALRTAQFFHAQVSTNGAPEAIDLSPVIDMQYKSLELFFRETFEEPCSRLIHQGILQRRLDVIGYARPIPRAMDEFENYLSSLPLIREIPFFSKFKLRKMLRAICQFRPGRRFTLDGLKAFALFFLCFSRQQCRYGLEGLFPIGFDGDTQLFEFCKSLHILQDARNRAAHEGFHPDASNDIDGIWQATAEIVQTVFLIMPHLESTTGDYAPKNRSQPVIEKKVS